MHWFDSLKGEYLGYIAQTTKDLKSPCVFAGLPVMPPMPVPRLSSTVRAGELLEITIPAQQGLRQVFHFEFIKPDGTLAHQYNRDVENKETDKACYKVYLALNENTGKWKVKITDAATGRVTNAMFTVQDIALHR